jgi:hypothetical protein
LARAYSTNFPQEPDRWWNCTTQAIPDVVVQDRLSKVSYLFLYVYEALGKLVPVLAAGCQLRSGSFTEKKYALTLPSSFTTLDTYGTFLGGPAVGLSGHE